MGHIHQANIPYNRIRLPKLKDKLPFAENKIGTGQYGEELGSFTTLGKKKNSNLQL